jgi:hypothetical protein
MLPQSAQNDKISDAAISYGIIGWRVLPIRANSKIPAIKDWPKLATTKTEVIARWWEQNPAYNIGIATGAESGIIVIDVDRRSGGIESWDLLCKKYGEPETLVQLTAGGGLHVVCKYREGIKSQIGVMPGIDILSDGKMFVANPSTIDGRSYEWDLITRDRNVITEFPEWPELRIAEREEPQTGELPDVFHEGERNSGLTRIAGKLWNNGFSFDYFLTALQAANDHYCKPKLPAGEVYSIAKSVSRYERPSPVEIGIGGDAEGERSFLTHIRDLGNSKTVEWRVENWLPQTGIAMIHGVSGHGKSFAAIDLVMHIASGQSWSGSEVKPGSVVFLAGEGRQGIPQRIAAWQSHYNHPLKCDVHVSEFGIELDDKKHLDALMAEIDKLEKNPDVIFVDTLNTHMSGDENLAQDTAEFIKAAKKLARRYGCLIVLVHHVGHNPEAKNRARGSSAWRAALDSEISVTQSQGNRIKVCQTKNKEGELSEPKCFTRESVEIAGGATSCVLIAREPVVEYCPHEANLIGACQMFRDQRGELLYIGRENLIKYLITKGIKEKTARQYVKASASGKMISALLEAKKIREQEEGWVVIDDHIAGLIKTISDLL